VSWDGFQREALAELGLATYVLAGADAAPPPASHAPEPSAAEPALLRTLLRAAAADPTRADVLVLCQQFLAVNPTPSAQARRALWPTLRRLRRPPSA